MTLQEFQNRCDELVKQLNDPEKTVGTYLEALQLAALHLGEGSAFYQYLMIPTFRSTDVGQHTKALKSTIEGMKRYASYNPEIFSSRSF